MEEEFMELNDRFSFDDVFRRLLAEGYDNDEAMQYILDNYSLGLIVMQERVENNFYEQINQSDKISSDLKKWRDEIAIKIISKLN